MAPVIILGGIVTGYFTATEAAAIAAFYALLIGVFVYRELGWKNTMTVFESSALGTANIMLIIGCASIFAYVLGYLGAADQLTDFVTRGKFNAMEIVIVINIIVFILGMFMESGAILILLVPIVLPVLKVAQVDLIYFGVVFVLNLMIGMITPPVGMVLFVVTKIANITFERMSKAIIPFVVPLTIVLILCIAFPPLVTWLPNWLMP